MRVIKTKPLRAGLKELRSGPVRPGRVTLKHSQYVRRAESELVCHPGCCSLFDVRGPSALADETELAHRFGDMLERFVLRGFGFAGAVAGVVVGGLG